jgi:hypothetical protein
MPTNRVIINAKPAWFKLGGGFQMLIPSEDLANETVENAGLPSLIERLAVMKSALTEKKLDAVIFVRVVSGRKPNGFDSWKANDKNFRVNGTEKVWTDGELWDLNSKPIAQAG